MHDSPESQAKASRPKDRSLEAYKAWMTELIDRFTTDKTGLELTEQEWVENWREYWKQRSED